MNGPMLTCKEFIDFIGRYLDGELSESEQGLFDMHLANCKSCPAYLETYRQTIALGQEAFAETAAPVPDDVPEEIVRGILAARRKSA